MATRMDYLALSARTLALVALLWTATAADAKVYVELRPRASMVAGFDDNVLLDGSGADGFGQATPGLKLDLYGDHRLHIGLDCQAGLARVLHPDQFRFASGAFAANESCLLAARDHLSARTSTRWLGRVTYAQDPFALAGLGLLLRPGQSQIFIARLEGEVSHALSAETQIAGGFNSQALRFGSNDPGNGYLLAPYARYVLRTAARTTWDFGGREQLFFAEGVVKDPAAPVGTPHAKELPGGLVDEGHAALLGWRYQLTPYATALVRGGPMLVTGRRGNVLMPTARFEIEAATPTSALHFAVGHDLVSGASRAGALVGDVAEFSVMGQLGSFDGHLGAGVYRNVDLFVQQTLGSVGYGGEVSVDYRIGREWKVGVAALRDARLSDTNVGLMTDRDVFQLRLTWERAPFQ